MKTIAQQIKWNFETNDELEIKDKNGNQIYFENSRGEIEDNRPPEIIEHEGHKYQLIK